MADNQKSVLMVCLGNICRSVMAESILKELVQDRSDASEWVIDSAATSRYEIGNLPDPRTNQTLKAHRREESSHRARQITKDDYNKYQYIFGFDESNMRDLGRKKPKDSMAVVKLLGDYDEKEPGRIVVDPYMYDMSYFETCYEQCERYCKNFLREVSQ